MSGRTEDIFDIHDYLLQQPFKHARTECIDEDVDEDITLIKYLSDHRIELNTMLAAEEPEAFWNWLSAKILKVWSERDYRRAIFLDDYMQSPTKIKFDEWYQDMSKPIIADSIEQANQGLAHVKGFIDDIEEKQEEIEEDIRDNTLLKNERVQKIDSALEQIMNGKNLRNSE